MHRVAIPPEFNTMFADGWMAEVPYIVERLSEHEHLPFLVRLMTEIQRAGVDLSLHWDCLLEGIILEELK